MIEHRLLEASAGWFPPTPSVAERARRRLPARPDRVQRLPRRSAVLAVAGLLLAGTAVAASWLDFVPGVRLHRVERLPSVPLTEPLIPGREVTLAEARGAVPFTLLLPEGLGRPEHLYLDRDGSGAPVVTGVYGGYDRARLVLTQWIARDVLFDKPLRYGTRTEFIDVAGASGIWIEGPDHEVFYLGTTGEELRLGGRLVGNVLIWQRGAVSYRLEADVARDRALDLAASLRRG